MNNTIKTPRFSLGQIVATPGCIAAMEKTKQNPADLLRRHVTGDWGDLCEEDKQSNEQALVDGSRLLSAYLLKDGVKVWLITESDRSASTFLLPDEY